MFEEDEGGIVCVGPESADAQVFSFQLFQSLDIGADEDEEIIPGLHGGDEHQIVAGQVGLNHRADVDDGRFAGGQSLRRHLPAAQKDRIDVESVLFEQAFLFGHPNMTLRERQGRVAQADFFELLADD